MPAKDGDSGAPQGLSWSWELDFDSLVRGLSEAGLGDLDDLHSPDCPNDPHISDRPDDPRSPGSLGSSDDPDALDGPDGGQLGAGMLAGRVAERPARIPVSAAAEVALELTMSQYGAAWWADLAVQLSWRLAATGAALAAGVIDLTRPRLIAEATGRLTTWCAIA